MKRLFGHLSAMYVATGVTGALSVLFIPVAVHRLGAAGYGLFSIYSVLTGYVGLVELGVGKHLVRLLSGSHDPDARRERLRLTVGMYLAVCGVLLALLPVLAWVTPRWVFPVDAASRGAVQLITALSVLEYVLGVPSTLLVNNCISGEDFGRYPRFQLVAGVLRYGLAFAAVLAFARPELAVGVIVGRRLIEPVVARAMMGPLPAGAWRPRWNTRELRSMLGHSSVLSLGQFLQLTVVSLGALLVNATLGLRALGVYRAVFDLASKLWYFSGVVGFVAFPRFARMVSLPEQHARLRRALPELLTLSWMMYGALAVTAAVSGPWVLRLFGLEGDAYAKLFVLLTAGVAFNAHASFASEFLQASGRYDRVVRLALLSLGVILVTFFAARVWDPLLAIGWAWLLSQALTAAATDAAALRALSPPPPAPATAAAVRLVSAAAVLLSALVVLGAASRWALVLGVGLTLGLMAHAAVRIPLVRLSLQGGR